MGFEYCLFEFILNYSLLKLLSVEAITKNTFFLIVESLKQNIEWLNQIYKQNRLIVQTPYVG